MACPDSCGSRPPIPAPCAVVAALDMPLRLKKRTTSADTRRTTWASNLSWGPSPATSTRLGLILPRV